MAGMANFEILGRGCMDCAVQYQVASSLVAKGFFRAPVAEITKFSTDSLLLILIIF